MSGVNHCIHVRLFCFGRHPCRWTPTLGIHNNDRCFGFTCKANSFSFKRKPWAGRSGDCTYTCIVGTNSHGNSSDFIFCLNNSTAKIWQLFNKVFHNFRRRCNRISGHETAATCNCTHSDCIVPD